MGILPVERSVGSDRTNQNSQSQFDTLTASELYCPKCRRAQPVRERLLLILPHSEIYEYRCATCGESVGTREVSAPANRIVYPF